MIRKRLAHFVGGIFLAALALASGSRAQDAAAAGAKDAPVVGGLGFTADLDSTVDSKKAKAGDAVAARSTEVLKVGSKIVFPKGTKFVGHVTQASARAKGDADSVLAMQFDKAVLKNGEEVPVELTIRAMAAPRRNLQSEEGPGQDPMAGAGASATTSPMTGAGGRNPNARQDAPMSSPRNGGEETGGNSGLNEAGQLTAKSRGVYGMSGVRLAADDSKGTPVSIVVSTGKNVHLDAGTRLLLMTR